MATFRGAALEAERERRRAKRLAGQHAYLAQLAKTIWSRRQLERMLEQEPDTIKRAEIRKLILPMCRFLK
jgi:hypothetical protein